MSPSVEAPELHWLTPDEARRRAQGHLSPIVGPSALASFRITDASQADWLAEVGHWLDLASSRGFLPQLLTRANLSKLAATTDIHPNEDAHFKLQAELAPAQLVHYLEGTGWKLDAYEPPNPPDVDIDVSLFPPNAAPPAGGMPVAFQVKASDRPGEVSGGHVYDGENDEHILKALEKARKQLPSDRPAVVAFLPQRRSTASVSQSPGFLVTRLFGSTRQSDWRPTCWIERERRGAFFAADWSHVGAVLILDLLRGDSVRYACTILINPNATHPVSADWFPRARVCVLDGSTFRWVRGEPTGDHRIPDGTKLDP